MSKRNSKIDLAYLHCQKIAQQHYENFPVASIFLPAEQRLPICALYAFARTADDFADEGDLESAQRLRQLSLYRKHLDDITQNKTPNENIFIALSDVKEKFNIPIQLFQDLLSAFEQDVLQKQFQTTQQLLNYCMLSANPIGQLMLYINKEVSEDNIKHSNEICTALQLINFIQDLQQDMCENQRLYIPIEDLNKFNITPKELLKRIRLGEKYTTKEEMLIKHQIRRAEELLTLGQTLLKDLKGRFKFEIALITQSGFCILHKLKQNNSFSQRPRLNQIDKITILVKSVTRFVTF